MDGGTGDEGKNPAAAAATREWLQNLASSADGRQRLDKLHFFDGLFLHQLRILRTSGGRALCGFKVPKHLTNESGNWSAGAIAAMIDDVGAAAIFSAVGEIKISVDFDISYFAPATANEEVEVEASVVHNKGKLSAVVVDIRKKGSGEPVALGRQWMTSVNIKGVKSKL